MDPFVCCTASSASVISANEAAISRAKTRRQSSRLKRVEQIVHLFGQQHAELCGPFYLEHFEYLYSKVAERDLKIVESFARGIIDFDPNSDAKRRLSAKELYSEFVVSQSYSLNDAMSMHQMYLTMKTFANKGCNPEAKFLRRVGELGKRSEKYLINQEKFKRLFEDYLVTPCKNYVKQLGAGVFIPASLEARWRDKLVSFKEYSFHLAWAQFEICSTLCKNEESLGQELIQFAQSVKLYNKSLFLRWC